jgi:hypothetical protein
MIEAQFGSLNAALAAAGLAIRAAPIKLAANLTGPRAVTDAIRAWVRMYGEVPTLADWDPARARRLRQGWRIARYNQGDWPSARAVQARFGSMSKAIEAAGLPPRPVGSHGSSRADERRSSRESLVKVLASTYADRPTDPDTLAMALRSLANARRIGDPTAIHSALIDIAARALALAEHADAEPRTERSHPRPASPMPASSIT